MYIYYYIDPLSAARMMFFEQNDIDMETKILYYYVYVKKNKNFTLNGLNNKYILYYTVIVHNP